PVYNDCVIPTPIYHDGHVYATVGFSLGSDLIKIGHDGGKFSAEKVYSNKNMVNQNGGVVLIGEHVYGYSESKGWVCQDFKSGKNVWAEKRKLGRGSLTAAEGKLYCFGEDDGIVVLADASPKAWKEDGRFEIPQKTKLLKPSGKIWTHPVIADGKLYLRDQDLLFCY